MREQGSSDRKHLLLSARQDSCLLLHALLEGGEELTDTIEIPDMFARTIALPFEDMQVLSDRKRGEDPPSLGHQTDAFLGDLVSRLLCDVHILEGDGSSLRRREPDD